MLNTCASATGPAIPLEGTGSLLRGFLQAGVPHVIGTLWNLSDQHAKDFVVRFYRYSIGGSSFSTALRRAKLDFLSSRQTSNPFFWAPYVIYGD